MNMQLRNSFTNDKDIRLSLKQNLKEDNKKETNTVIIEELGLEHGAARIDIAVVNGILHGYELKSDVDTLNRLPEQMRIYNSVLDRVTLVVGRNHLHKAIKMIPEWWGVVVARINDSNNSIYFYNIRKPEENPSRDSLVIVKLLWRAEALNILEQLGQADGVRSKPKNIIYNRLVTVLDQRTLRAKTRECMVSRANWRFARQHMPSGD